MKKIRLTSKEIDLLKERNFSYNERDQSISVKQLLIKDKFNQHAGEALLYNLEAIKMSYATYQDIFNILEENDLPNLLNVCLDLAWGCGFSYFYSEKETQQSYKKYMILIVETLVKHNVNENNFQQYYCFDKDNDYIKKLKIKEIQSFFTYFKSVFDLLNEQKYLQQEIQENSAINKQTFKI